MEVIFDDNAPSLRFKHPSGTLILVGPSGEITINSVNHINISGLTVNINPITFGSATTTMFGSFGFGEA